MTSAWYIPGSTSAVSARRSVSGWTRRRPPWRGGQRTRGARRSLCLGRCKCQEEGDWAKVTSRYFVFNREDRVCIQMRWGYHCFILSSAHNRVIWEIKVFSSSYYLICFPTPIGQITIHLEDGHGQSKYINVVCPWLRGSLNTSPASILDFYKNTRQPWKFKRESKVVD